jgi:signal transduction histidine kinase
MPTEEKKLSLGRDQTDKNLQAERQKTDLALAETQEAVEEDADRIVQHARETADAVLETAREKADEQLAESVAHPASAVIIAAEAIAHERAIEDESLQDERITADETLDRERREDARALKLLLPLEREATDRTLLTERARSDDALANRDDFLGMVCHDLRDLLNGIMMSSTLLSEQATESEEGQRAIKSGIQIQRYAARMNRLIGDLIDVASIDAGKLSFTPAVADSGALVHEAVETFQASAQARDLALTAEISGDERDAHFDHDRMLQVLANLITNAIKFTPKGGTVRVRRQYQDEAVLFSVSDSGGGIPADMLQAIFERFWQVGKNDRRGLGLGLYISKCIVDAHGGKIWAESKPGKGSRFFFTIPLPDPA